MPEPGDIFERQGMRQVVKEFVTIRVQGTSAMARRYYSPGSALQMSAGLETEVGQVFLLITLHKRNIRQLSARYSHDYFMFRANS